MWRMTLNMQVCGLVVGGQVRCVGTCLLTPHRWGPGEALGHRVAFELLVRCGGKS